MTTYLSLFTGAGGFDLGANAAGWDCIGQVEINPACLSLLQHHWPNVPQWDDIQTFHPTTPADIIIAGFPCQDISSSGNREGLNGARSGLYTEVLRIVDEMRTQTNNQYPKWLILENVRGILTIDDGKGFRTILNGLAQQGALLIDWALLDSQFFGTPQRRQRVFIAACFDSSTVARCAESVFPVAESSKRNPNKREVLNTERSADCFEPKSKTTAFARYSYGKYGYGVTTLMASARGDETLLATPKGVRRFTPLECERLQTWPDNHTQRGVYGEHFTDAQRYRMIGNGVTASVAQWICEQIEQTQVADGNR